MAAMNPERVPLSAKDRAPDPKSINSLSPLSARTSTQAVFPPYRVASAPPHPVLMNSSIDFSSAMSEGQEMPDMGSIRASPRILS